MIEPAGTRLRASTPEMIASAMTPAPTTLSVEARSGLIVGLYEAGSQGQIVMTAFSVLV